MKISLFLSVDSTDTNNYTYKRTKEEARRTKEANELHKRPHREHKSGTEMAYRALATPSVDTDGEQDDSAPMICAWCPEECNERMGNESPFTIVSGQHYCWPCLRALAAASQCDGLTYSRAAETLEKLEQAKQQAKEKKEELSDYELKSLIIKWKHENEKRSRNERRRKRRRKNN
jgi:hypothetical protein